jgi:hypothetical protein
MEKRVRHRAGHDGERNRRQHPGRIPTAVSPELPPASVATTLGLTGAHRPGEGEALSAPGPGEVATLGIPWI